MRYETLYEGMQTVGTVIWKMEQDMERDMELDESKTKILWKVWKEREKRLEIR